MTALHVLKEGIGCPVITLARLFRPTTCEARQTSESERLSPVGWWCSDLGDRRVQPATAARVRCVGATSFPKFHDCGVLTAGRGRPPWTPSACLVRALTVVVVAITRGASCPSPLELRIPRQIIKTGDSSVEALLPQGRGCFELDASGWSRVPLIDAVGGPPDRNFANECGAWVTFRRGPDRLGVLLASVISNSLGEVGH
jgi:hypothetical protein